MVDKDIDDSGGNNNGHLDPGETVNLTATITNIGGVDFTTVWGTLETSDPYLTITDNSGIFGALLIDSTSTNTGDPFEIRADSSAPQGHAATCNLIVTDNTCYTDTFSFDIIIGSYHYLVWDPDPNHTSGPVIDSLLQVLGYNGNYSTTLPFTEQLSMYSSIFVCVGIYSSNYVIGVSSPEAQALEAYLNNGGNMFLEGGDVWYYDPSYNSGFNFNALFGINASADGAGDCGPVQGQTGVFTNNMYFNYGGENSYIDHIDPTGSGFLIFRDADNNYNCGVANNPDSHRTVGLSFELGRLTDGGGSTRASLLDSIMGFFGLNALSVEEPIANTVPENLYLRSQPNPFFKNLLINYQVPLNSSANLEIFDVTGRLIKTFEINPGEQTVNWDRRDNSGQLIPSGTYFISLKTTNHQILNKIIAVE
ncbi:MAG: hypothetical protein APR63_03405 [Desulfuromonas sp. SDB]|nr:MAG: hypothetical protein APR63_03405 [Desulfuromonas sp. SDB]